MSSKPVSITPDQLPKFDGRHYKQWVDRLNPMIMMLGYKGILYGTLAVPAPVAATAPIEPQFPSGAGGGPPTTAEIALYNAQLGQYTSLLSRFNTETDRFTKLHKECDDKNTGALGVLNQCLSFGIWEQIKDMDATAAWTWLQTTYASMEFVEVLEDFKVLTSYRLDLLDPNLQITKFRLHYSRLPSEVPATATGQPLANPNPIVSQSIASLILLQALLLTADPTQESVYQCTFETYTASTPVLSMTLDTPSNAIRKTWAAKFGHLPDSQKPRHGDFYLKKGQKPNPPKNQHVQVAQKTSAIRARSMGTILKLLRDTAGILQ